MTYHTTKHIAKKEEEKEKRGIIETRVLVRSRAGGGRQRRNQRTPPPPPPSSSRNPDDPVRIGLRPPPLLQESDAAAPLPPSLPQRRPCTKNEWAVPSKNQAFGIGEEMEAVADAGGAGLTRWQAAALSTVAGWVWTASFYDLTRRTRRLVQPWVTRRVLAETPAILRFQVRPVARPCISLLRVFFF
jgi:hypothetical protein